jgi:hypothetical protein
MPDVKTLALRKAAVEQLADEFDASLRPFTSAASVIHYVRDRADALTPGTGWTAERLALRVADEVHKRRFNVRAEPRPIHDDWKS